MLNWDAITYRTSMSTVQEVFSERAKQVIVDLELKADDDHPPGWFRGAKGNGEETHEKNAYKEVIEEMA